VPENDLIGLGILLVEDDPLLSKRISSRLQHLGTDVTCATSLAAAKQLLQELDFDLILLDVHLPDGLGTQLLKEKLIPPNTGVIVMTAHGGVDGAVEAMKLGALDYLIKPFEPAELPLVLRQARLARQNERLAEYRKQSEASRSLLFGPSLQPLQKQLDKILAADLRLRTRLPPILIEGETGSGKTSIARWIHQSGPRRQQQLVEVNCSALPEALAESELFGHERGAFTDARSARMGLFEAANGGTLFLDELPSLSPPLQAKVLTAIEDHQIRRVGSNKTLQIDVRLIAATNRDLKELVAEGRFRQDLYHRLDLFRILVPPLRQRGPDIIQLAEVFMRRLCQRHRLPIKRITSQGQTRLLNYPWPGNVRELLHELERAIVFEEGSEVDFPHLTPLESSPKNDDPHGALLNEFQREGFSIDSVIDRLIDIALEKSGGNVSAAARLLSVPRDYIRYRRGQKSKKPPGK